MTDARAIPSQIIAPADAPLYAQIMASDVSFTLVALVSALAQAQGRIDALETELASLDARVTILEP
jgi:hypothetical protein